MYTIKYSTVSRDNGCIFFSCFAVFLTGYYHSVLFLFLLFLSLCACGNSCVFLLTSFVETPSSFLLLNAVGSGLPPLRNTRAVLNRPSAGFSPAIHFIYSFYTLLYRWRSGGVVSISVGGAESPSWPKTDEACQISYLCNMQ